VAEIIYILTNETMPGLVKIGSTSTSVEQRMEELYKTGVPVRFKCFYAAIVNGSADEIERKIHKIFKPHRLSSQREFFRMDAECAQIAIELIAIEEITPKIGEVLSEEDSQISNDRRQIFRFSLANVPKEVTLYFTRDRSKTCKVLDDRYVEFEGKPTTLSGAASQILRSMGWKSGNVAGPLYWLYEDESLDARRRRIEEGGGE
jgi:hypothetical protein